MLQAHCRKKCSLHPEIMFTLSEKMFIKPGKNVQAKKHNPQTYPQEIRILSTSIVNKLCITFQYLQIHY